MLRLVNKGFCKPPLQGFSLSGGLLTFNKKLEQESPDFSRERNAFLYQLLSVLVPDVLFYNLFAHIPQSTHIVTMAP